MCMPILCGSIKTHESEPLAVFPLETLQKKTRMFSFKSDSSIMQFALRMTEQIVPGTFTDCYTNRVILGPSPNPPHSLSDLFGKQLLHC